MIDFSYLKLQNKDSKGEEDMNNIGKKLKLARIESKMTQEMVAEVLDVSRQTISNWENNKSYPDIISVIKLSELYAVSLDELLKGDEKMIQHLEESTNEVKSRYKFTRFIQIMTYLVIWVSLLIWFWASDSTDAMAYSLLAFYIVLPVITFIISFFIGKGEEWGKYRWFMIVFFGIMCSVIMYCTFSLANTFSTGNIHTPDFLGIIWGGVPSALGILVGVIVKEVKGKRFD